MRTFELKKKSHKSSSHATCVFIAYFDLHAFPSSTSCLCITCHTRLKSPVTRLFVEICVQANKNTHWNSALLVISKGIYRWLVVIAKYIIALFAVRRQSIGVEEVRAPLPLYSNCGGSQRSPDKLATLVASLTSTPGLPQIPLCVAETYASDRLKCALESMWRHYNGSYLYSTSQQVGNMIFN